MKRRKVISAKRTGPTGHHFELKLECGHTVVKRDNGRCTPPARTSCDPCAILLDRARAFDGWFLSRQVGGLHSALKLLEREGLVTSSQGIHGSGVHWKARPE